LRLRSARVITILGLAALPARAGVVVEQIEGLETPDTNNYAPIDFGGSPVVTETSGSFSGITFHAVDPSIDTKTLSSHAFAVGGLAFGSGAAGNPWVTDVYSASADPFIASVVDPQASGSTTAPLPGHFSAGVEIVNNSYVDAELSNLDALRRWDFMIQRDDVTFVAAAAIDTDKLAGAYLDWSAYNSLAVSSDQTSFSPTGSPGKTHADVWFTGQASFATATVSGYAAGLYGNAQAANQTDAQHDVVMRSLLMTGADKNSYTRDTANNLSLTHGAGEADFTNSLASLQGGEQSIQAMSGGAVSGVLATSLKGWGYNTVPAGGTSVVMFHSSGTVTGITASLNWDVTSASTATSLDTTDTGVIFPQLDLEVRAVNIVGNQYVLGPSMSESTLQSDATGDNVQYLYFLKTLPAGNYAFVITGDPSKSPVVGFSYNISSTATTTQWAISTSGAWNNSVNWSNGIPSGPGAQANFLTSPTGLTGPGSISLNGNRTVGQITFNNLQSYTIIPGTGGILTIDDTGDAGGIYPSISVASGNHVIAAPVSLAAGVNVNISGGSSLNILGNLTGVGGLLVGGQGTLMLGGIDNYGDTNVTGGALNVNGAILSTNVTVAAPASLTANGSLSPSAVLTANGKVNFGANSGGTVVARTLGNVIIGSGGSVVVNPATSNSNRTVLVTGGLVVASSSGAWTGTLDLNNNDMIVKNGNLTNIVSQLQEGFNAHAGYWNGPGGIVSSSAASDTTFLTTLAAVQNDDGHGNPLYGSSAPYGLFDGQSPADADVLVKYTYYGDADLNGTIDGRDYSRLDIGFRNHLTGWINGDFNYDGVVDGSDYALIDNAFNQQSANLSALAIQFGAANASAIALSVPEPGSLSLLGVLAVGGVLRRRRVGSSKVQN
jgi:hypothetical protein